MIKKLAATLATMLLAHAEVSTLDSLLGNIALRDDLSQKTLRESDGSVIVFTREDLDRMRVTTLGEIIEKIPYIRYNENDLGLLDPAYVPFQPSNDFFIKVYVDDREVIDGMGTSGLQLFSNMGLGYIDHIEVYFGGTSFNIGVDPSIAIIKLYTKDPSRENSEVVNLYAGTYGTKDLSFYSAYEMEDYSYLLYFEHKKVKRKKYHFNGATLSRDRHINMFYAKLIKGNIRLDGNIQFGKYDPFIATTLSLEPKNAKSYIRNIYTGLYYENEGLKAYTNFSYFDMEMQSQSDKLVGILPQKSFPYIYFYDSLFARIHEMVIEGGLSKKWKTDRWSFLWGTRGRYQKSDFKEERYGDLQFPPRKYRGSRTLTGYVETKYQFSPTDLALFSFKKDKIYEDAIKGYDRNSYRVGYVRNTNDYTLKLFGISTSFIPPPVVFVAQETAGALQERLMKQGARVFSIEYKRKKDLDFVSLQYSKIFVKDYIVRDPKTMKIHNINETQPIDAWLFRWRYHFNLSDKIEFKYFLNRVEYPNNTVIYKGGDLSLFKKLSDRLDTYTGLVYRDGYNNNRLKAGFDLYLTIDYKYDDSLNIYLKGQNLLGKALKSYYYGYDIAANQILELRNVDVIDRAVFIGLEYQF